MGRMATEDYRSKIRDMECVLAQWVIHERSSSCCVQGHPYMDPGTKKNIGKKKVREKYAKQIVDSGFYQDKSLFDIGRVLEDILKCDACKNRQRLLDKAYEVLGTDNMSGFC